MLTAFFLVDLNWRSQIPDPFVWLAGDRVSASSSHERTCCTIVKPDVTGAVLPSRGYENAAHDPAMQFVQALGTQAAHLPAAVAQDRRRCSQPVLRVAAARHSR